MFRIMSIVRLLQVLVLGAWLHSMHSAGWKMKARLNNHAQLNAPRRRLRQRAADAESTSAPTQTQQHPKTAGESHRVPKQTSEEHTSELQSRGQDVYRFLLETHY